MILLDLAMPPDAVADIGLVENVGEVEALGLVVIDGLGRFQSIAVADHLLEVAETKFRHQFAHFLGDVAHEIDHLIRAAGEFLPQAGILRRHSHGAGIEMANAHHNATERDQRGRGEAEFLGAKQRANHDIATSLQLAIYLDHDSAAQIVEQEGLVSLRQPEFPGGAGVLDARQRRSARAAIVAADQHDVGVGLGHAGGNRADSHLRHQRHADEGAG